MDTGIVFVGTRGAAGVELLKEWIPPGVPLYVWPQNDAQKDNGQTPASERWLQSVGKLFPGVRIARIPPEFEDHNEALRVGFRDFGQCRKTAQFAETGQARKERRTHETAQAQAQEGEDKPAEELARKLEAQANAVAKLIDAFYDQQRKEYVLRVTPEVYQGRTEAQFKRDLRFRNLSTEMIARRNWSQIDLALRHLQENKFVSYVGALAGKERGYYDGNGVRFWSQANPALLCLAVDNGQRSNNFSRIYWLAKPSHMATSN